MCVCSVVSDSWRPHGPCSAPWSMGSPRQDSWNGLLFPSPGDLPDQGIEPMSLVSPPLAGRFFTTAPPGKPEQVYSLLLNDYCFIECASFLSLGQSGTHLTLDSGRGRFYIFIRSLVFAIRELRRIM